MLNRDANPLLAPAAMFLVALSLSIGWGIRGNFGHEAGAMLAGVLSAVAVALLSRRDDWRERIPYFALLGGLGWGFGGSISYMYPVAFTESGHTLTTVYGYAALMLEGGLWCGLGAAGTALAATLPRERLTRLFGPLCFVLAFMALKIPLEPALESWLAPSGADTGDATWTRHKSPLYWFDADWLPALLALMGVATYDLWNRAGDDATGRLVGLCKEFAVAGTLAAVGFVVGFGTQRALETAGVANEIGNALTVRLGDLDYVNPETGRGYAAEQLLTNWPQFFHDYPQGIGPGLGLMLALFLYFAVAGRFRNEATLFLYLSAGWLMAFLLLPTFGSIFLMKYGGLRLMPPRSDDWAGILGVFIAALIWSRRHSLPAMAHAISLAFLIGGAAFASVPMFRFLVRYPGHPWRFGNQTPEGFTHYQNVTNWHSVMEQLHGFGLGIAIAVTFAWLWRNAPPPDKALRTRRWTEMFAVIFAFFGIGYMNLHKLVHTWIENGAVAASLKAPFVDVAFTPMVWFRIVWWTAAIVCAWLLAIHLRRRLDIVPATATGQGQLFYVLFLWLIVIGNLNRAIPGLGDSRMVTEWVLFLNACLATALAVALPRTSFHDTVLPRIDTPPHTAHLWRKGLAALAFLAVGYAFLTLALYQSHLEGKPWSNHKRFGPDATWRVKPILKQGDHP